MKQVYDWVGVTRQAAYQHRMRQDNYQVKEEAIIVRVWARLAIATTTPWLNVLTVS
jgi:hypothetical protein